jgi:hypothetical protein
MGLCYKKESDTWNSQNKKRKRIKHIKVPKYWKKRKIAHTSKAIIKREKVMIKGVPKILGLENILHTCTSWSKCMTCISLDLVFDLTIYVM